MGKKRMGFIDASKAFCIILVIIYHIISPGVIKDIVGCLGLPAVFYFFIVSGYFSNPHKTSVWKNILKRLKQLFIPFLVYSLVLFFLGSLYLIFAEGNSVETCLLCLRNYFLGAIWDKNILNTLGFDYLSLGKRYLFLSSYWFIAQMIISSIFYFVIINFVDKNNKILIATIVVLSLTTVILEQFNIVLVWNLHHTPMYVAVLMIGYLFRKIDIFDTKIFKFKPAIKWTLTVLCLLIVMSSYWIDNSVDIYKGVAGIYGGLSVVYIFIRMFAFFYFVSVIFIALSNKHQMKFMNWVGRNTLHYYLIHVFVAWACVDFDLSYSKNIPDNALMISICLIIITFIICTIYVYVREKISNKIFASKNTK